MTAFAVGAFGGTFLVIVVAVWLEKKRKNFGFGDKTGENQSKTTSQ
jgi:hypothetical protein